MVYYNHRMKGVVFMDKREKLIQMYSEAIWAEYAMWASEFCCGEKERNFRENEAEKKIKEFKKIVNTLEEK